MNAKGMFDLGGGVAESPIMGGFVPTMWVGPITAQYIYEVSWLAADLAKMVADHAADMGHAALNDVDPGSEISATFLDLIGETPFDAVRKSANTDKFAYYYQDGDRARMICRFFDLVEPAQTKAGKSFKHGADQLWRFQTSVAQCLTMNAEQKGKFKTDDMLWDSTVKAMGSSSPKQHIYHLLQLPSAVWAYAKASGIDVPDMSAIDELSGPSDEVIITEALRDRLIGGGDIALRDSQAWADRAALWAALGEPEPEAFGWTPEVWAEVTKLDTEPPDDGRAKLTTSVVLGHALHVMRSNWGSATWAGVLQIPDPEPRNMYNKSGDKNGPKDTSPRIPLLRAFYPDEATAAAAVEELTGDAPEVAVDTTGLSIPDVYVGDADMWLGQVKQVVTESLSGVLALTPPLRAARVKAYVESADGAKYIGEMLMASSEQFTAAVEVLAG